MTRIFVEDADLKKHDKEILIKFLHWYDKGKRNINTCRFVVDEFFREQENAENNMGKDI